MARPLATLEISFTDPASTPNWIDESGYLRRFSINRGRSTELDKPNAGTAVLTLDNRDGRFDPVNTSGAYYPNVLPMRRVKITSDVDTQVAPFTLRSSTVRGTTQTVLRGGTVNLSLFSGFVESWSQTWAQSNGDAWTTVQCVDGFKVFNLADFVYGYRYQTLEPGPEDWLCGLPGGTNITPDTGPPFIPDEPTGTRINRVLDCIDWPAEDRDIDVGTVTVGGSDVAVGGTTNIPVTANSLAHMLDAAATEAGGLFMDKDGRVRFIDANHVPALDTAEVYGGGSGEIHFLDLSAPFDDAQLWNAITITTNASALTGEATAEDATSIAAYYRRELSVSILATTSATMNARAATFLDRYKDPHLRIEQLSLVPSSLDEWRYILRHELGDVVLVRKRPAIADQIARELRIQGISIEAPGGTEWNVTWRLSDVQASAGSPGGGFDFALFDSSTFGA